MLLVVDGVKIYSEQITCHSLKTDGVNHLALTKKLSYDHDPVGPCTMWKKNMEYKAIWVLTTELYGLVISRQKIQTEASVNIIVYKNKCFVKWT